MHCPGPQSQQTVEAVRNNRIIIMAITLEMSALYDLSPEDF